MLSILNPQAEMDPIVRKRVVRLSILLIPCWLFSCVLLLAWFFMKSPPFWLVAASSFASVVALFLSGRVYRLRHPEQKLTRA